jgi:hypothetical protein
MQNYFYIETFYDSKKYSSGVFFSDVDDNLLQKIKNIIKGKGFHHDLEIRDNIYNDELYKNGLKYFIQSDEYYDHELRKMLQFHFKYEYYYPNK